jgi:hypothetical protein
MHNYLFTTTSGRQVFGARKQPAFGECGPQNQFRLAYNIKRFTMGASVEFA